MASLITCEGVLSYPKVFKSELPKDPKPDDKKSWSTTILFKAEGMKSPEMTAIVAACVQSARDQWGPTVGAQIHFLKEGKDAGSSYVFIGDPANNDTLRMPFRNDTKKKGYPDEYVMFINPRKVDDPEKNIRAPEVIARNGKPLTDPREIYPGVRARISVGPFTYNSRGNRGVSLGLNNVQKLGDGPRIDNSKSAEDEFGGLPDEEPAGMPLESGPTTAADLAGFIG